MSGSPAICYRQHRFGGHLGNVRYQTRKQRRLVMIGGGMSALAVALMLNAFRDSIVFFNSPSEVVEKHVEPGTRIRFGGSVKDGSLMRGNDLRIRFEVPTARAKFVTYQRVLPDLFREIQGVTAEGALDSAGVPVGGEYE